MQNQYSELAENFQAYSIQKDVTFCKISALKRQRCIFQVFHIFCFVFRPYVCLILMHKAPKDKKKYTKIHFRCKIYHSNKCRWQNWLNQQRNAVKSEKLLCFSKIQNVQARKSTIFKLAQTLLRGGKLHVLFNGKLCRKELGVGV